MVHGGAEDEKKVEKKAEVLRVSLRKFPPIPHPRKKESQGFLSQQRIITERQKQPPFYTLFF